MYTPIIELKTLNDMNRIFVKREELIPFSFGGNKVRIAEEYINHMKTENKTCMVSYGSQKSNLCRVLSNRFAMLGIPCYTM